jgi:pyruvate,water dikinase
VPKPRLMVNLSVPELAASAAQLDVDGVGLMRAEFIALGAGVHPLAVLEEGGEEGYVEFFHEALVRVATAFHPRPVTYRSSDLKSNEYRALRGGDRFEPEEANPMVGARGVFRYLANPDVFRLELRAVREARASGLDNIRLMLPFVRTVEELRAVRQLVVESGPWGDGFQLWAMSEVPATALLAPQFAAEVDGVSIGSNDLAQLVLGVDRDSRELSGAYSTADPAVVEAIRLIVEGAHEAGRPVSICGDHPSRDPEFVEALVRLGIDSISVVPDAVEATGAAIDSALATM